jgi:hypothetical protein
MHEKEWGVIVTWTYTEPPYLESGEELYDDLVLAYENGAKYITIFDSNENYTQGTLNEEHLAALKQFWQYMQDNPRETSSISDRVAYVLPNHYGYGFRGPNDKIWGLWGADNITDQICNAVGNLLEEYGSKLDIIYDEDLEPDNTYGYSKLIFWNSSSSGQPNPLLDLPAELVYTVSVVTLVAVVGTGLSVYFWNKRKNKLRNTTLNCLS